MLLSEAEAPSRADDLASIPKRSLQGFNGAWLFLMALVSPFSVQAIDRTVDVAAGMLDLEHVLVRFNVKVFGQARIVGQFEGHWRRQDALDGDYRSSRYPYREGEK